jgi:NAD-dependent dihydropyrimidine dehydrogenase PreA subunit
LAHQGRRAIKEIATVTDATAEDIEKRQQVRDDLPKLCNRKPAVNTTDIRKLLRANYDSHAWEKRADKCYSCGSCNLVCPTCYCFDVLESVDISLNSGERTRRWDGCLLKISHGRPPGRISAKKRRIASVTHIPQRVYMMRITVLGLRRLRAAADCMSPLTTPIRSRFSMN